MKNRNGANYAFAVAQLVQTRFILLEQDHISDGSGGFGAFASTFNSNPLSVPSE